MTRGERALTDRQAGSQPAGRNKGSTLETQIETSAPDCAQLHAMRVRQARAQHGMKGQKEREKSGRARARETRLKHTQKQNNTRRAPWNERKRESEQVEIQGECCKQNQHWSSVLDQPNQGRAMPLKLMHLNSLVVKLIDAACSSNTQVYRNSVDAARSFVVSPSCQPSFASQANKKTSSAAAASAASASSSLAGLGSILFCIPLRQAFDAKLCPPQKHRCSPLGSTCFAHQNPMHRLAARAFADANQVAPLGEDALVINLSQSVRAQS